MNRESVIDTFPWPQPTAAARAWRRVRAMALPKMKGGWRAPYRTRQRAGAKPPAHTPATPDTALLATYRFNPKQDWLARRLALQQAVAAKPEQSEPLTPPACPGILPTQRNGGRKITCNHY